MPASRRPRVTEEPAEELDPISQAEGFEDINEREEVAPLHYGISSFGADFPVDSLVRRLEKGDIVIPTFDPDAGDADSDIVGFQRDFVWSRSQSDRFIESLLLGFPVPGIFLVQGARDIYLVLDGQQRLLTLRGFYRGVLHDKAFRLQSVQPDFQGLDYESLDSEVRRRLDNSIIHATIVKQESPSDDQSGIYKVFERLNTGGTLLQPQEIRVALYNGRLIQLLRDLNTNSAWRQMCGPKSKRLKDQELILRFFAFSSGVDEYKAPMKEFLNRYTAWNRDLDMETSDHLTSSFESSVDTIREHFGQRAFRPSRAVNAAVVDSIMTVVAEGLENDSLRRAQSLKRAYERLMADSDYTQAVERATAREEQVELRLSRARHFLLT